MNPPGLIGSESFVTPASTLNVCDSVDDDESVTVAEQVAKTATQNLSTVYGDREITQTTKKMSEKKPTIS